MSLFMCAALTLSAGVSAASASSGRLGPARYRAIPLKGVSPARLAAQVSAGATIPMWSSTIKSPINNVTYPYRMVGNSPLVHETNPVTNVPTDVIPVALAFPDSGITFDPTKPDSGCLPNSTATADSLLLGSPVIAKRAYVVGGANLGTVQYLDGFQREEFSKYVLSAGAINPGYHVNLSPVINHAKITVNVGGAGVTAFPGNCIGANTGGAVGELDIGTWDNFVKTTLLPSLKASVTPTHFPLFLFYNVVMTDNGGASCCIIGYHSAFASPSFGGTVQTYSTSNYITPNLFPNSNDVGAISHEVGEWMDDPTVNNATPAWGHIGQVSGCQGNLEVGDPLSGTRPIPLAMSNGVTYHTQELAFRDWFYRTPSVSLHAWYSSFGIFRTGAGALCH